jgi:hypothetical protein
MPLSRRLILGFAAGAASLPAAPQTVAQPSAAATQEVLALREKIRAAVAAKDRAALEALYADNFMHMRDSGRADLKAERIGLLLAGEQTIETAPEEEVAVQVYGPATAVATGASAIKDPATGKAARFRWVAVYVRGDAGWQVALSQASRAPVRR